MITEQLEKDMEAYYAMLKRHAKSEETVTSLVDEIATLSKRSELLLPGGPEWIECCRRLNRVVAFAEAMRSYESLMRHAAGQRKKGKLTLGEFE